MPTDLVFCAPDNSDTAPDAERECCETFTDENHDDTCPDATHDIPCCEGCDARIGTRHGYCDWRDVGAYVRANQCHGATA